VYWNLRLTVCLKNIHSLWGGDVLFNGGFVDVVLGFTPEPDDMLESLVIQGTLTIMEYFEEFVDLPLPIRDKGVSRG